MGISDLPGSGTGFKTKNNISSFEIKLKNACRQGDLKNLEDNIPAIIEVVEKYENYIRRGEFSHRQKTEALSKIRKIDKKLNSEDLREIEKIFEHLRH